VGAYTVLLRQRYEMDPRYKPDRPFKEPEQLMPFAKLVQIFKQVPYTDAFRHVQQDAKCVFVAYSCYDFYVDLRITGIGPLVP